MAGSPLLEDQGERPFAEFTGWVVGAPVPSGMDGKMRRDTGVGPEEIEPHLLQHGRVSYLAIPARDPITSAVFYEAVFGWTLTAPSDERVSQTAGPWDNERVAFSDEAAGLVGAFVAGLGPSPPGVMLYIYVDDIAETVSEIEERGSEIVEPVHRSRGVKLATFRDPGRNMIGVWEAVAP